MPEDEDGLALTGRQLAQRLMDRAERAALAQVRVDTTLQQIITTIADLQTRLAAVSGCQQSIADLQARLLRIETSPLFTSEETVDIRRGLRLMRDRHVVDTFGPEEFVLAKQVLAGWSRVETMMAQVEFNNARITDFGVRLEGKRIRLDDLTQRVYELQSSKPLGDDELLDVRQIVQSYKAKTLDHHTMHQNAITGALVVSISAIISILLEVIRRAFGLP